MEAIEIKGTVIELSDKETIGDNFTKRTVVIELSDGNLQYPEYISLQGIKDTCDKMDELQPGTEATFKINLKGRAWTNKDGKKVYFNTLQIWKFEVTKSVAVNISGSSGAVSDESQDPPF